MEETEGFEVGGLDHHRPRLVLRAQVRHDAVVARTRARHYAIVTVDAKHDVTIPRGSDSSAGDHRVLTRWKTRVNTRWSPKSAAEGGEQLLCRDDVGAQAAGAVPHPVVARGNDDRLTWRQM